MMRDERLRETNQRARARGFLLLFFLLLADLNYRLFYLGESIRDHWDLAAIWGAGCIIVLGSLLSTGGFSGAGGRLKRFLVMMSFVNMGVSTVMRGDYAPASLAQRALINIMILLGFGAAIVGAIRLWEWRKGLTTTEAAE